MFINTWSFLNYLQTKVISSSNEAKNMTNVEEYELSSSGLGNNSNLGLCPQVDDLGKILVRDYSNLSIGYIMFGVDNLCVYCVWFTYIIPPSPMALALCHTGGCNDFPKEIFGQCDRFPHVGKIRHWTTVILVKWMILSTPLTQPWPDYFAGDAKWMASC